MIRLRVSDLDQWVRYIEPERPEYEVSTESFLAYMRREEPPSDAMLCGKAFHTLMENLTEQSWIDEEEIDGFRFEFGGDYRITLPTEREGSIEKVYDTAHGPVLLRGRFDGREPGGLLDYKLTTSTFDAERYAESLQWRAYLDMADERRFRYLVFQAKRKEQEVWIHDMHPLVFWRYPEMSADVRTRVEELAGFVACHVPALITTAQAA